PTNTDAASELAVVYESGGEFDEAKKLLIPIAKRLGDSEGARVQLEKSLELGGKRFRHAEKVRDLLKQA
ncbi:MAG: hypothetical protein AAF199_08000, partial [Pseudomonadota bacterium]